MAAASALASTIPSWLLAGLLILIGFSWLRLRRSVQVAALILRGDGRLETVAADDMATEAVIHPHTLVLSFLVALLYRQNGRLHALTLFGDSLAVEDLRQLRLR